MLSCDPSPQCLASLLQVQAQLLAEIQGFKTYAVDFEAANLVPADDGSDDDFGEGGANRPPLEIDDDDHDEEEEEEDDDDDEDLPKTCQDGGANP